MLFFHNCSFYHIYNFYPNIESNIFQCSGNIWYNISKEDNWFQSYQIETSTSMLVLTIGTLLLLTIALKNIGLVASLENALTPVGAGA